MIKEILAKTRKMITDQANWSQGSFARDAHGYRVSLDSEEACKFCVNGALGRVVNSDPKYYGHVFDAEHTLTKVAKKRGWAGSYQANDEGGHAEILMILDEAISVSS